ncbi:carbohydrate ABC transporter permease [Deinococcus alpinitundrae]|uniref:carbohydrate ABC transporter permease n=1 Tax=Deinococcus alpinitundrae TaxID=468913 RepID=UPI001ED8DA54|nr:sugar ABC transporter permease [Deinococcus alpinitundrae]
MPPTFARRLKAGWPAYLFILPAFVFLAWFAYYPAYLALTGAFTNWDGFLQRDFVGLSNFQRAITDPVLGLAARNNLIWIGFGIVLGIVPALGVAELIFHLRGQRRQYAYRTFFALTLVIPSLVSILIWSYFYRGEGGLLNLLLDKLHLSALKQFWLSDPKVALYSLIFMGFPWLNVFYLLILYAGLQNIPSEVIEAAKLDGATGWRRILSIDLPLLAPQIQLLLLLSIIANVQNLLAPLIMTGGGPFDATQVPALVMYQRAIQYGEFGYSNAISVLLFVVVVLLTVLSRFLGRRGA